MVFGSAGYFKTQILPLVEDRSWTNIESWDVEDKYSHGSFQEGKFLYSGMGMGISSVSADCDKFWPCVYYSNSISYSKLKATLSAGRISAANPFGDAP